MAAEEAFMLRYQIWSIRVKVTNPSPIFFDNISVVLNENNPGIPLNNKTVSLRYHFIIEHGWNNIS